MLATAYRGAIGRTRTRTVHVTDRNGALASVQVHTSVDAASDPELVERLLGDTLNLVEVNGAPLRIAVPVIYHDPVAEQMVLVLGEAHRHRELDERIAVLEQLRDAAAPIPPYVKDFAVVFGAAGLRAHLDQRRGEGRVTDTFDAEIDTRSEIDGGSAGEPVSRPGIPVEIAGQADSESGIPVEVAGQADSESGIPVEVAGQADSEPEIADGEIEDEIGLAPSNDVLTTEVAELLIDEGGALDDASLGSRCYVDATGVHAIAIVGDHLAHRLSGALDVRLVLHRTASYPVIALLIGPPEAMRSAATGDLVVIVLDVAAEHDRSVLHHLARAFELNLHLVSHGRRIRRCRLTAPLAENTAYIMRAASDHLRGIAIDDEPDYGLACALVLGAGYDLLGAEHAEHAEFRDDKLAQIATAQQVRRALAIARRFTRPEREEYLVCTRGFPLPRWDRLRRDVVARAVAWGLWMGPELAQLAVSEGFARSRRELVIKLERGFHNLRNDAAAFDIDAEAAADNLTALAAEARAHGFELRPLRPDAGAATASEAASAPAAMVTPPRSVPGSWSNEELLAQLEDTGQLPDNRLPRVVAALALCHRADPRHAGPVIAAAMMMNRAEAVRVLAMAVRFGAAAKPALLDGLSNDKAYLRHGCALALALLRSDDATEAVIDLLLSEPTELWREIARAIGHIGAPALAALADRYEQPDEHAATAEARIVWAMAHIGVRGGKQALAAMAEQPSIVAPLAAKAVTLLALAASDQVDARRGATTQRSERDLTVNQAFSRQFFEALEQDRADANDARPASTVVEP